MDTLHFLYKTIPGRMVLKLLTRPGLSVVSGRFLDSRASRLLIKPFIKSSGMDTRDYQMVDFSCFNEFFCRHVLEGKRVFPEDKSTLSSPCDGLLKVYPIRDGLVLPVKQSSYSIASLLHSEKLAEQYEGGYALVFRLCVDNYHRYAYFESGRKSKNRKIAGVLHTVRPIALQEVPVFTENAREYSLIKTEKFGTAVQMEVGALLVGKIVNDEEGPANVLRGQEKGHFEYGGSTIILLLQKDKVKIRENILRASMSGQESLVKMGDTLGVSLR